MYAIWGLFVSLFHNFIVFWCSWSVYGHNGLPVPVGQLKLAETNIVRIITWNRAEYIFVRLFSTLNDSKADHISDVAKTI